MLSYHQVLKVHILATLTSSSTIAEAQESLDAHKQRCTKAKTCGKKTLKIKIKILRHNSYKVHNTYYHDYKTLAIGNTNKEGGKH